jgi:hypothetical protein
LSKEVNLDTVIIGCRTLEDELSHAMRQCGCDLPVRWAPSGLHNTPKKLRAVLQEELAACDGYSTVLMAMGFCGNVLEGLQIGDFTLILPRVDDCISLLLGSCRNRLALSRDNGAYFMTAGWLGGERNILLEYEYAVEKYGESLGREIFKTMFGHYKSLALLNTGCYRLREAESQSRRIAETLNLEYKLIPADISYLHELLCGPWENDKFLVLPPGHTILCSDLVLSLEFEERALQ